MSSWKLLGLSSEEKKRERRGVATGTASANRKDRKDRKAFRCARGETGSERHQPETTERRTERPEVIPRRETSQIDSSRAEEETGDGE